MYTQKMTLVELLRPLTQFFTNLLGPNGSAWWFAFKRFLRKENPWIVWAEIFTITVKGRISASLMYDFERSGVVYDEWIKKYLQVHHYEVSLHLNEVIRKFALQEVRHFGVGIKEKIGYDELHQKVLERGLEPLSMEDILVLAMSQGGKYVSTQFVIFTEPLKIDDGEEERPKHIVIGWNSEGLVSLESKEIARISNATESYLFAINDFEVTD